jgi:hypothetical protein
MKHKLIFSTVRTWGLVAHRRREHNDYTNLRTGYGQSIYNLIGGTRKNKVLSKS